MSQTNREGGEGSRSARLGRFDSFQQQHRTLAISVAVCRKFGEDESHNLASMMAYWAFFSVFPLFLVFATVLAFLPASVQTSVQVQVTRTYPLLGTYDTRALSGQWWELVVGLVSALWGGMAVIRVAQSAFNSVWEIPYARRPKLRQQVLRSLSLLATVGFGLVISTLITGYVTGTDNATGLSWYDSVAGYVLVLAMDIGLFIAAFRTLTDRKSKPRELLPGSLVSGVAFFVLQSLSSLLLSQHVARAEARYGIFATVITVLWWLYLQSIVTLLGAQLNVVLAEQLYPRSLTGTETTEGDRRTLRALAGERTYQAQERVNTQSTKPKRLACLCVAATD